MTTLGRLLRVLAVSASSLLYCACHADSPHATEAAAMDAQRRADLAEAVALLDSWRGARSVLDAARARLDGLLSADPANAHAHREYARYHIMSGYIRDNLVAPASLLAAERSLNEALRLDPGFAEAYVLAGHLHFLQGRLDDAMEALDKARALGTTDPWLPLNTADVLLAQGKSAEAASNYRSVIESGTGNRKAMSAAFGGLIAYYQRTRQFAQVDDTYRRQIAFEPTAAWNHGNYAGFLLCTMDDPGAAITRFRAALARMNYGLARSGLAAALYRQSAASPSTRPPEEVDALIGEARSLRSGTPLEVVTEFCRNGPAVAAMANAPASVPR